MLVKITKVSRPFFWYKNLVGECIEVRPRVDYTMTPAGYSTSFAEQYYTVIEDRRTERYIAFDDCVDCGRYMKIKKLKDKISI